MKWEQDVFPVGPLTTTSSSSAVGVRSIRKRQVRLKWVSSAGCALEQRPGNGKPVDSLAPPGDRNEEHEDAATAPAKLIMQKWSRGMSYTSN